MSRSERIGLYTGRLVLVILFSSMVVSTLIAVYLKFEPIGEFRYMHF